MTTEPGFESKKLPAGMGFQGIPLTGFMTNRFLNPLSAIGKQPPFIKT